MNWFTRQISRMGSVRSASTAYSSGGLFTRHRGNSVYVSPENGQIQNPPQHQKMSIYERFVRRRSGRNEKIKQGLDTKLVSSNSYDTCNSELKTHIFRFERFCILNITWFFQFRELRNTIFCNSPFRCFSYFNEPHFIYFVSYRRDKKIGLIVRTRTSIHKIKTKRSRTAIFRAHFLSRYSTFPFIKMRAT